MSAPWPYRTEDGHHPEEVPSKPTWKCPDGTCECHPPGEPPPQLEFSVLLVDERGASMRGARCRIHCNGIVINDDDPYADADGWVTAVVTHAPETVLVEWAPPELPMEPRYPYRKRYFVDLREDDEEEAARRRLHNLGFSNAFTLEDNVRAFQEEYGYEEVTGRLADIRSDLEAYHDDPSLPETSGEEDVVASPGSGLGFVDAKPPKPPKSKKKPESKPRPHPTGRGHQPTGGGATRPGKGAAKPASPIVQVHVFSFFSLGMKAPMLSGTRPKAQRWGAGDAHPVEGAELRIFDAAGAIAATVGTIDLHGHAKLDVTSLADGTYTLLLSPPPGHELRRGAHDKLATGAERERLIRTMVGPGDVFTGDANEHTRFRMLEVLLEVKAGKLESARLVPDMFVDLAPGVRVAHGAVLLERGTSSLWIDYKPDFVQVRVRVPKTDVARRGGGGVLSPAQFIHLHHTEGPTPGSAIEGFVLENPKGPDEDAEKSAHYLVDVDGFVVKLVNETCMAQHAGPSHWYDLDSCKAGNTIEAFNDLSVGIEQVNLNVEFGPASRATRRLSA